VVGALEQLRPLGQRDDLDPGRRFRPRLVADDLTCSTSRSTSRKPNRWSASLSAGRTAITTRAR
jgi:hypothetical protein